MTLAFLGAPTQGGSHTLVIAAAILAIIGVVLVAIDGAYTHRPHRPLWAIPAALVFGLAAVICVCAAILFR